MDQDKIHYHAELLSNRVKKRYMHFRKRFKKRNIDCFRLYDWDIPEVRAVVDWYAGHVVIAEYTRTQTGPDWLPAMAAGVGNALGLPPGYIHLKRRETKNARGATYAQLNNKGQRIIVNERDLKFWVNLEDFLDTGLYSDHRDTRVLMREMAKGQEFLNLYAYTGAFTCAAIAGGAKTTVTVERSAANVKWAKDNFKLNGFSNKGNEFVQADVDSYLLRAKKEGFKFSLCFIDPPSFFRDKKSGKRFDINGDHPQLLRQVLHVMNPGGVVVFSTNHQRFEPRFTELPVKELEELTPHTIPEDYRNRKVHRCWRFIHAGG